MAEKPKLPFPLPPFPPFGRPSELKSIVNNAPAMIRSFVYGVKTIDQSIAAIDNTIKALDALMMGTGTATLGLKGAPSFGKSKGNPKDKANFEKIRQYTIRQAIKNIIAVEDHLRSSDEDVCIACLEEKHLPALEMYAQEGLDYSTDEKDIYLELAQLIRETYQAMSANFDRTTREKLAQRFREIRKKLAPYETAALASRIMYEKGIDKEWNDLDEDTKRKIIEEVKSRLSELQEEV